MTEPARNATSPSSAPAARTPSGPDVPPAPSTMLPSSTAIAAVNAPPSSSRMNDTSRSPQPRRSACSCMASAAAHTLSAVPMSTRFTFRCAGTDARCTTPGVSTTGIEERASSRISERSPPMPPGSPSAARYASRRSFSVRSRAAVSGRP